MKKTALLAILALSLLALGLGYMMEQQSSQSAELSSQALMNLAPEQLDIAEVDGVEIITAGNKVVAKVEKTLEVWRIPAKFDYFADTVQLAELLQALSSAEVVEAKTKLEKYHARLGVEQIAADSSTATMLRLHQGDRHLDIVVGNSDNKRSGQFVRFAESAQVYLIDRQLPMPSQDSDWLKSAIFSIDYDKVRSMTMDTGQNAPWQIERKVMVVSADETPKLPLSETESLAPNFSFKGGEAELEYPGVLDGLVRNILGLSAIDVVLAEGKSLDVNVRSSLAYQSTNGKTETATFELGSLEGKEGHFLQLKKGPYLLQVSEFDYKQISKHQDEYLATNSK